MAEEKKEFIELLVNDESDLYIPYSPDSEFNQGVRSYIKSKIAYLGYDKAVNLKVISSAPIDEEKFRAAVANWIRDEKVLFMQESKEDNRMLIGMLVIASLFITLSLVLTEHVSVLSYTIIPVLGSVALGRAAGICISDLPINKTKRMLIDDMQKNGVIEFEVRE